VYYEKGFGLDPSKIDINQPQRLMDQQMAQRGLTYVDALPAFRAAASRTNQLFGRVDRHFTPNGHALMASVVAPALQAALTAPSATKAKR